MPYRTSAAVIPSWFQPFMYTVVILQMQMDDFNSFRRKSVENCQLNDTGVFETLFFYGHKLGFLIHRILLPIYLGQGVMSTLFLFLITEIVAGIFFGYFTQVTHIGEHVEWPADKPIPRDWAELQVRTAVDFCTESFFWTYLSGYLNYQVMHHLFPSVQPHFYVDLLPIAKECMKEYNVEYFAFDSFLDAVKSHWKHLEQFQVYRERYYQRLAENKKEKSFHVVDVIDYVIKSFSGKVEKNVKINTDTCQTNTPIVKN